MKPAAATIGAILASIAVCIILIELWASSQGESVLLSATGNILLQPGNPMSLATFSIAKAVVSLATVLLLIAGMMVIARNRER